jgi:hypothetical protein
LKLYKFKKDVILMGIDFRPKSKNVVVAVANGIVGYKLPKSVYSVEDTSSLKARADWYRNLLGLDNALFFSNDVAENSSTATQYFTDERSKT